MEQAIIEVRLTPRASADGLAGWTEKTLRVRVKAPPVDGRANMALCELLARAVGVPPGAVQIVSGFTGRTKRVRIVGCTQERVLALLGPAQS